MTYDYSELQQERVQPTDLLGRIADAARRQRHAEEEVVLVQMKLDAAKKTLEDIAQGELPKLMEEAQQEELTTADGLKVTVSETVRASIKEQFQAEAFAWLTLNNHDGLIKTQVIVDLNKGETEFANKLRQQLVGEGKRAELKRSVHPSTLSSFVREQLEKGVDIPQETFGVFRQRVSKIKDKRRDD